VDSDDDINRVKKGSRSKVSRSSLGRDRCETTLALRKTSGRHGASFLFETDLATNERDEKQETRVNGWWR
jgi:hypothetical protein